MNICNYLIKLIALSQLKMKNCIFFDKNAVILHNISVEKCKKVTKKLFLNNSK